MKPIANMIGKPNFIVFVAEPGAMSKRNREKRLNKDPRDPLLIKIESDLKSGHQPFVMVGLLGDQPNCMAMIEQEILPPEGGSFSKLYGCNYLWKGLPHRMDVDKLGLGKAMVSVIPRKILADSIPMMLAMAFEYFFLRRKFYKHIKIYSMALRDHTVLKARVPLIRMSLVAQEIYRATLETVKKFYPGISKERTSEWVSSKNDFWEFIMNIMEFICLFLEVDTAYRFRLQDIFEIVSKEEAKKNVIREVRRLIKSLASREESQGYKWRQLSILIMGFLMINSNARNFIREFLLEIKLEDVKLDDADWYFCLERKNYNFRGLSFDERLKIKHALDAKFGNYKLKYSPREVAGHKGFFLNISILEKDGIVIPENANGVTA